MLKKDGSNVGGFEIGLWVVYGWGILGMEMIFNLTLIVIELAWFSLHVNLTLFSYGSCWFTGAGWNIDCDVSESKNDNGIRK